MITVKLTLPREPEKAKAGEKRLSGRNDVPTKLV
jgi:hypothetical protein